MILGSDNVVDAITAAKRMNEFGRLRTPFLFVIDFLQRMPFVIALEDVSSKDILFEFNGRSNTSRTIGSLPQVVFEKSPPPFERYTKAFNSVQKHIGFGNTYLLNLTLPTRVKTNLSLRQIFDFSKAKYKLLFFDKFVVFSPETFVQVRDGQISSFPMKGTIDAALQNAASVLLNDPKELAEHTTIVDLIRNDLSMVAKKVRVEEFRMIDRITTNQKDLLQVSSRIVGDLPHGYQKQLGDIVFALLPAGSISGAPKRKSVEIILDAEEYNRGYYTGICGLFDGNSLDSGVMIRYIESDGGEFTYKSGGGITAFSDSRKEYQELIDKVYVPLI